MKAQYPIFVLFLLIVISFPGADIFAQCVSTPTISSPTVSSISSTGATLGANVTANGGGGGCNASYGVRYSTTTPVGTSNETAVGSTTSASVYSTPVTSLTPGTRYYYVGYSTNTDGTVTTADNGTVFFYTLSAAPSQVGGGAFTSTVFSPTQIDLDFPDAAALSASGFLIFRSTGASMPTFTLNNGQAPAGFLTNITDITETEFSDAGLTAGTTYNYTIIPYSWDGANAATYNYNVTTPRSTTSTILSPEPTNHVTNFQVDGTSITAEEITVTWTDASGGTVPTGYLVVARSGAGTFASVTDGTAIIDDLDFSNDNGAINILPGVQSATFSGLDPTTQYFFEIYPYTGTGAGRNYYTTAPPSADGTTISITATLLPLTGGLAISPLEAGSNGTSTSNAILGFSLESTGSQTVSAITVSFDNDPTGRISSFGLIVSDDNTFATTGGGQSAITLTDNTPTVSGTGPYLVTLTPSAPIDISSIKYLFVVATINGGLTASTVPGLTASVSSGGLTLNPADITANTVTGSTYLFRASDESLINLHSTTGITSPINFAEYSAKTASSGLTWGATPNSTSLAHFRIRDGGGSSDEDNHPTVITSLTLEISSPIDLNAIALFSGSSISNANALVPGTEVLIGSGTIVYNGLNLVAPDDGDLYVSVRATFNPSSNGGVDDNSIHSVVISAATASSTGSSLSATPLTGATTGAGANVNNINVVSDRLTYVTIPTEVNPNTPFQVVVAATDADGNTDENATDGVAITASLGPGALSGGAQINPVMGEYNFNSLSITLAGTYNINANDESGGQDLTQVNASLVVKSLGVKVTNGLDADPNAPTNPPPSLALCYGSDFQNLGTIKIYESDPADFGVGVTKTFSLQLPFGYVFDPSVTTTPTLTGADISAATALTYSSSNTVVQFSYSVSATVAKDAIAITGLRVKYILTSAPMETAVLRRGGSALQEGNAVSDELEHAYITISSASNEGFDFNVESLPGRPAIQPFESKFSSTTEGIILKPDAANPTSTSPMFSGNGVSFSNAVGAYVFSPTSVGAGDNYPVTFTAKDVNGCIISVVKEFDVFQTVINGLSTTYCVNDETVSELSVDNEDWDLSLSYPAWSNVTGYATYSRVSYGGAVYYATQPSVGIAPSNTAYWTRFGYTFEDAYTIEFDSYKYFESVSNPGTGTITVTSPRHGLKVGSVVFMYVYAYDVNWNYVFQIPYDEYTITAVTLNTFDIVFSDPNTGTFNNISGYFSIPLPTITGVTALSPNSIRITAPKHGLLDGTTVQIYIEGMSNNGGASGVIDDWYTVSSATLDDFVITSGSAFSGTFSGYGQVNIFAYRISDQFVPADVSGLNTRFSSPSSCRVGFLVRSAGCAPSTYNTCRAYTLRSDRVDLFQLPILNFDVLAASYCPDSAPVTLVGNQQDGTFVGLGVDDGGAGDNTADFDPTSASITINVGFDITYSLVDENGCTASVTKSTIVLPKLGAPTAPDVDYCQFETAPILAVASGAADADFKWYNDSGLTNLEARGTVFDTGIDATSPQTKTYYVTQSGAIGCESNPTQVEVAILTAPPVTFTPPAPCVDREFTLNGPGNPVNDWQWSFSDGTALNGQTVSHQFASVGNNTITLKVQSVNGCSNESSVTLIIGPNPVPDFTFDHVCADDQAIFTSTADQDDVTYVWNYGDGSPLDDVGLSETTTHGFASAGDYPVEVTATNIFGCYGSTQKNVSILEFLTGFNESNPYLMSDIDNGAGYWVPQEFQGTPGLWDFGTFAKTKIASTTDAWVTSLSGNYPAATQAALNSPCLNLNGFDRPIISFDYIVNIQNKADGLAFEYSIDDGVTWITLGAVGNGLNWFNSTSFFAGKIGNSLEGWSGYDSDAEPPVWKNGRIALDNIPLAGRSKIRFRAYFASDNNGELEGFALKNVKIENRNRLILLENFTNHSTANTRYTANHTAYEALNNNEVVKMQYHLGFPADDPIYAANPADPAARAAFYGISNTNALVPRTYFDGFSFGDITEAWATPYRLRQTLEAAPFKLVLKTVASSPNQLHVTMDYSAVTTFDLPEEQANDVMAYIAVLEKSVDGNSYVVRRILPNAAGRSLQLPISTLVENFDPGPWTVDISGMDLEQIALMGWVQNAKTKFVYQAAFDDDPDNLPTIITGREPTLLEQIQVYPNPADNEMTVVLPGKSPEDIKATLTDSFGRIVTGSEIRRGSLEQTIYTRELASGIYILQLQTQGGIVYKKVMISHE
jgi:hypothetical protein